MAFRRSQKEPSAELCTHEACFDGADSFVRTGVLDDFPRSRVEVGVAKLVYPLVEVVYPLRM